MLIWGFRMQKLFNVNSQKDNYSVFSGRSIVKDYLKNISQDHVIICDKNLIDFIPNSQNNRKIIIVEANELSKDLNNISPIILELKSFSFNRDGLVIAIGGGIIQDIACFVSSIYMRGVDWIYFPTTFLGMCDSCIGGKSSINVGGVKNLVGNFHPPKEIILDSVFLNSLSADMINSGLCEALKICFASSDDKHLEECLNLVDDYLINKNIEILSKIFCLSLSVKKWFIEIDEFDKNERQLLNFGHTFGHAIEGACDYAIPHGIAVGIGMIWAIYISTNLQQNLCPIRLTKLKNIIEKIVFEGTDYKSQLQKIDVEKIMKKFISDKKHQIKDYVCILPNQKGYLVKKTIPRNQDFFKDFSESFIKLKEAIS